MCNLMIKQLYDRLSQRCQRECYRLTTESVKDHKIVFACGLAAIVMMTTLATSTIYLSYQSWLKGEDERLRIDSLNKKYEREMMEKIKSKPYEDTPKYRITPKNKSA